MTLIGTLWGNIRQRQTKLVLSVATLNGFELDQPQWSMQDKPADFTDKFPYGKIPAFESTDGFKLIEGTTIARYLSSIGTEVNLLGSNAQEAAIVDQWVHFAEHEIGAPTYNILSMICGFSGTFNRETLDKDTERLFRALNYLESYLATRLSGYVALDTLSLADFAITSTVFNASRATLGSAERAQYPLIFAHYSTVTGHEQVTQYWGTEEFIDIRITEPITCSFSQQ